MIDDIELDFGSDDGSVVKKQAVVGLPAPLKE